MAPGLEPWRAGKTGWRISRSSLRLFRGRDFRSAKQLGEGGRRNWRENLRAELRRAAESGAVPLRSAASHRFPECGPQSGKPARVRLGWPGTGSVAVTEEARALSLRRIELAATPARGSRLVRCWLRPCSSRPHWPRLCPLRAVFCQGWPRFGIRLRLGWEPMLEPMMLEAMRCPMRLRLGRMQSARPRPAWHRSA